MMIFFSFFLTGSRLPTQPTAARLTSAIAWKYLAVSSFPSSVQVFVAGLKRSTCREKQDITSSVKEFHTIPHLWCYFHRPHQWRPLADPSEQLWDEPASWEIFTLHWTPPLKGSYIKEVLHNNYNDCLHDGITTFITNIVIFFIILNSVIIAKSWF